MGSREFTPPGNNHDGDPDWVLVLEAAPSTVSVGGVVDGGSFRTAVAPGSIASAFGTNIAASALPAETLPLPTTLAGATARLNSIVAPLFYASPVKSISKCRGSCSASDKLLLP